MPNTQKQEILTELENVLKDVSKGQPIDTSKKQSINMQLNVCKTKAKTAGLEQDAEIKSKVTKIEEKIASSK